MSRPLRRCAGLAAVALCCVVSAQPMEQEAEPSDPFAPLNRKVLVLNYVLDRIALRPAAHVYRRALPGFVRRGIRNAIDNLDGPRTAINQCLQGKGELCAEDAARFAINSTLGIGGLFDPAAAMGLPRHDEDFGQTLGEWGMGTGPYLMLPVIGPTTLRDGPAKLLSAAVSPTRAIERDALRYAIPVVDRIDARSRQLGSEPSFEGDPYATLRDAYLKRRAEQIAD